MDKKEYVNQAVNWVEERDITSLKVNFEGYEKPKGFVNKSTDETIFPDITYINPRGYKNYIEIALKQEKEGKLVTRWKLLSLMASMKNGKLFLLAPKGHKIFTQRLVNKHNINAVIHSI